MINYETRQKIISQVLNEIEFARNYKQGKTQNWKINEDLYYGRKINQEYARANVDLGLMQAHVHTILSKIDAPLVFKFIKRKPSQYERVINLNALRAYDQARDDWDIKDLVGKKQAIIYGRSINSYFADSDNGYKPHLNPVDVYDFLIDPAANGIDIETAQYLGDYGVTLTRQQLKEGVKSGLYLRTETNELLAGNSNATETSQEQVNKDNRTRDTNVWKTQKEIAGSDKFKFWRWGTTFEGKRYYVLITESAGQAVRIEELKDVFTSGLWWYWTYAAFPDLTEFWTPSFCDYVREAFMAQAISVNQMLDNAEQINKPQKVVNVGMIDNPLELKYRREGVVKVKGDFDINKAYQTIQTPSINTPIAVYNLLDGISQRSSGVTAASQGDAANNSGTKATIYEGNQANSADRFGYLNKSYSQGYKKMAKLYEWGVRDHLKGKVAIDILGPDGVQLKEVSKKDIFWKNDEFGVMVEASNAELALSMEDKKQKMAFLEAMSQSEIQNNKKAYEIQATIAGFTDEEIRQLMDKSEFGDADIMSEAERDIEGILDGKNIPLNNAANVAYKQRFVDYMLKNQESITDEQFEALEDYITRVEDIVMRNTVKAMNQQLMKQQAQDLQTMQPAPGSPPEQMINQPQQ